MLARSLLLAVSLSLATAPSAAASGDVPPMTPDPTAPDVAAFHRVVEEKMASADLVGVGVAILLDGQIFWSRGYGHADRARGIPYTTATVQPIGSITKTITGIAMMQAVEDGRLDLDADINDYLPFRVVNPHAPDGRITLRTLATHTSGVIDSIPAYRQQYVHGGGPVEPLEDFLRSYLLPGGARYSPDNFADAAPGTHYEYSNFSAALVGLIVERAVGKSLQEFTRERIFAPLRMDRTTWQLDPATQSKLYIHQDYLTSPIEPYAGATYPDGGVRTSVGDLSMLFLAMLGDGSYDGRRILSPESVREMRRFHFTPEHKPANVNLAEENQGLYWMTKFDTRFVGHAGTDPGVKTSMLALPGLDVGVVLFTNTSASGEDLRAYFEILLEAFRFAEAMKAWKDREPYR